MAATVALIGCDTGGNGNRVSTKDLAGHQKMVATLKRLDQYSRIENPYLGDGKARQLRRQLANINSSDNGIERLRILVALSKEELRLGNVSKAIALVSEADALVRPIEESLAKDELLRFRYRIGITFLRLGEVENCCANHNAESCILPIRGGGLHTRPNGSRRAIEAFRSVLESTPPESTYHASAKWLLNIAYMTVGEHPDKVPPQHLIPPSAFESDDDLPRFVNVAPALGLNTNSLSGGAVADDLDNDGYIDVLVSNWDTGGQIRLFINQRDGTFIERTAQAGLNGITGGLNIKQADYDNDGDLDVIVLRGAWLGPMGDHPNSLLRNNGDGTFTDVTFSAGLGEKHYPTQTAGWSDYDNDGDLDLYIGNEHNVARAAPCQLFQNNGDGTFTDVARSAGVMNNRIAKGVTWGDFNNDRHPDLYVSNLHGPNRLYQNNGDGTFTDVAPKLKVDQPSMSFPVWFWDYNNDGALDLYVSSYLLDSVRATALVSKSYQGSIEDQYLDRLYKGDGQGHFLEVGKASNFRRMTLPMGSNFGDLNNDGYPDFYLGTGYPDYESLMPSVMFVNQQGQRFVDVTNSGGFGHLQKGHGVAFADFDNDGDSDVFEQMGGAFPGDAFFDALYENPGFGRHWIGIQLIGSRSNRCAIGARIRVVIVDDDGERAVYRHVNNGGSFGANPLRQTIGLGTANRIKTLEVLWPTTGVTQKFSNVAMDRYIRIEEGREELIPLNLRKLRFGPKPQ